MQNYNSQFRSKLNITLSIKWKDKYDAVVVDCHHSLRLYGDRMEMSLSYKKKKQKKHRETPTSLRVPFRVKIGP